MQCSAVQCSVVQCSAVWCASVREREGSGGEKFNMHLGKGKERKGNGGEDVSERYRNIEKCQVR